MCPFLFCGPDPFAHDRYFFTLVSQKQIFFKGEGVSSEVWTQNDILAIQNIKLQTQKSRHSGGISYLGSKFLRTGPETKIIYN